ncbi:MAG TPA: hypothetical protein VJT09_10915 [Pyrinomonadaceae bacterium]|nr:hypothetical protein [Pyrinomonadaceae bacterium]
MLEATTVAEAPVELAFACAGEATNPIEANDSASPSIFFIFLSPFQKK